MIHESDVIVPVLRVLSEAPSGKLPTGEVRQRVKEIVKLSASDLAPLKNRPDQRIDQIIRNLKSHKKSPGNPFAEGLLREVHRGFAITKLGIAEMKKH